MNCGKAFAAAVTAGLALSALGLSAAKGQFDPFAAAAPVAPAAGAPAPNAAAAILAPAAPSSAPGMRSGFLSVEQATGRSYAGAQTKGVVNMTSLKVLPKVVSPLNVELRATGPRQLAAKPRIVVPTYALAIVNQGEVRASGAGAGTEIVPRASKISTVLIGVTDEMAAQLAEEAQADLIRRLREAGFDVVSQDQLKASSDYARLRQVGAKAPGQNGWAVYGPASAPLYSGHALTNAPLSGPGTAIALTDLSFDLNAVVLQPYLAIDYNRMEGTGNRTYSGTAIVSAEVRFRIAAAGANFLQGPSRGRGSGPGGTLQLPQPTGTDELFGLMFEIDNRSDDPAISNAFASLGLGSIYRQSVYYGVEVAPERYAALVRAAYQGLNAAIVSEVQKARS